MQDRSDSLGHSRHDRCFSVSLSLLLLFECRACLEATPISENTMCTFRIRCIGEANAFLPPEEGEQIHVDLLFMGRAQAMRRPLIDLQRPVLDELDREHG